MSLTDAPNQVKAKHTANAANATNATNAANAKSAKSAKNNENAKNTASTPRPLGPASFMSSLKSLLWLRLKSQRYLLPLLLLVVVVQLALGQASAYVLTDRIPPLSLAVQQLGDDAFSAELIESLERISGLEVVSMSSSLSADEVFRQERVQGLLVIPASFGERIEQGRASPVTLYPAPGVTNYEFAREQIAIALTELRARYNLESALSSIGVDGVTGANIQTTDLLDVVYNGPALQGTSEGVAPVYGVCALLVLLAFLHAALTVPTREDKRLLVHGRRAFMQQLAAALLTVWLVWLTVIVLFFAAMGLLFGVALDLLVCGAFVAIMLYVSLLAAFLAQVMGRHASSWLFLPLFLLCMTIGGGLWAQVLVSPLLAPLIPVAAASAGGSGVLTGSAMLLGASLLLLAILGLFSRKTPAAH